MAHPKIISLNITGKYSIQLAFSDGTKGIIDLSGLAGKGVFKAWDDGGNFNKAYIDTESGAVSWPGNLDIDTLNCYLQIKGLSYEEFKAQSQHKTHAIR